MTKIYMAAYKEFGDYKLLKKICDYMLCNMNKDDILFYVSTGESGDNTCMKYVRENGYKYVDWLPKKRGVNRAIVKLQYIKNSDHVILVTDGDSIGIGVALNYASKHVNGKIVEIRAQCNNFIVLKNGKEVGRKTFDEI